MSHRALFAFLACLVCACQAPSEQAQPLVPQFVSGDQQFRLKVDGVVYDVTYDLPPGAWNGPLAEPGKPMFTYSQDAHHLWVTLGELRDFDAELVHFRQLTEKYPYDAVDFSLTEPGRRADLVARFRAEEGVRIVNRFITYWPDPAFPVGLALFVQAPETDPLDVEPVLRSVSIARK